MARLVLAVALALALAAPAAAQWPTTDWEIREPPNGWASDVPIIGGELDAFIFASIPPLGERALFAAKYEGMLKGASTWFQSLGFAPPLQLTTEGFDTEVGTDEAYIAILNVDTAEIGSSHKTSGLMQLSTHPGFLAADTPMWTLMEASAVHELYHGVQMGSSASLVQRMNSRPPESAECPGDTDLDWLTEGTAAMVQIRWLEGQIGAWGHPFAGSSRAAWVRHFDQSLVRGSLPPEHRPPDPRPEMTEMETVSWKCDYGTWYFWYAVGDMIARTDAEKVAYTRHLFPPSAPWSDGGLTNVDAGLRAAAAAYDAIQPYRNGLYDLYPEFVAQYLVEDRFYGTVEPVTLGAPGLFETTSSTSGGPLAPLASRAWRVSVQHPPGASPIPYTVRFSLDAPAGTDRDDVHLIVDDDVAGRPVDPTAPYVAVERTDLAEPGADGTIEYFVRVANVAEAAEETTDAEFSLRVEVEGFYGEDVPSGPTAGEVGGELPPGFVVNGPGPWACEGGARSRALFDLMTPDELGRDVDRAVPELERDMGDMMDNMEIMLRRLEQQGIASGLTTEQLAELRREAEAQMATARAEVQPDLDEAADEMRARQMTELMATFVGQTGGSECQMTLAATLTGREGGAQILAGAVEEETYPEGEAPGFDIVVFSPALLGVFRSGMPGLADLRPGEFPSVPGITENGPLDGWEVCTMTEAERQDRRDGARGSGCAPVLCTAGQLVLERAEQGRIAGSFQFEVIKWPETSGSGCEVPARNTVSGHFNVASTDDGFDDNSLGGFGVNMTGSGLGTMPGMPILTPVVVD